MANENDIGGKVGLDVTDFKAGIAELNRKIKVIDSGFKAAAAGMDDWGKSEEGLQKRIESLNQITDLQRQKVENLKQQYEKVAAEKGENSKAAQDLLVYINKETASLNTNEKSLRDATTALDNFGKEEKSAETSTKELDESTSNLTSSLANMAATASKAAVAGVAALGAAAVGAVAGIVKLGNDSQVAMNKLQIQTGATAEEMEEFKDAAQEIYKGGFGEGIDDIATAMANVKQTTGLAGDELKNATQNALLLRDTFDFDVNESVNAANSLMKNFGITADEAYTLMVQGAQNGANKNGDLMDVLNEYSPHFAQLGLDAETFTNVLISGAENGAFSIDKVGDAIKEFGIRSKDMSDSSATAFTQLGLDADKMFNAFGNGGEEAEEAFQTVINELLAMEDPLIQNQAGVALFGTMFEDLGVQGMAALTAIDGAADSSADTLKEISDIKFDDLGSALEGIKRQLITGLQPATDAATNMISGIATAVRDGDWAAVGTAVTTGINDIVAQLTSMLPDMVAVATSIVTGLATALATALPIILPELAQLVIDLLGMLVRLIIDNGPMLIESAVSTIMTIINGIVDALPLLIEAAIAIILALANAIVDNLPDLVMAAVEIIVTLVDGILELLPELIPVALKAVVTLAKGLIDALPKLIEKLPEIIETIVTVLMDNLPLIISAAVEIILALVKGIINNLPTIITAAIDIVTALIKGITQAIPQLLKIVPDIFKQLKTAFSEIDWLSIGKNIIDGIKNGIKNAASSLATAASDAAKGALNSVKDFLGIHSPSRVMRDEVGKMMGAGMAEGIVQSTKEVDKAMSHMNSAVSNQNAQMSAVGSTNATQQTPNLVFNLDGLFAGAQLNLQNEQDIKLLAKEVSREIYGMQITAMRGAGIL